MAERLNATGHHALLHGDPCPDNAMRMDRGIMFVDLEQASLGDGRAELAYLRTRLPHLLVRHVGPGPALRQAETAYRATWRAHTGTEASGDLGEACAGWLIRGDGAGPTGPPRARRTSWRGCRTRIGAGSSRPPWQRLLHRLTVVAALGADHPGLACLASLSSAMRDRILALWPGLEELPVADDDPRRGAPP